MIVFKISKIEHIYSKSYNIFILFYQNYFKVIFILYIMKLEYEMNYKYQLTEMIIT